MGTAILSTSRGVITSSAAEREGVGGEVICFIW
jgi:small subunit ribosomal protein S8